MKKHFLVYKITNLINNKIYIGQHVTYNINDDYMGSGIHLKNAIKKYGVENFKKEIIKQCDSFEEMNQLQHQLVNLQFVKNPNTYNHAVGGSYGWKNCLKYKTKEEVDEIKEKAKESIRKTFSDPQRKKQIIDKIQKTCKERNVDFKTFLGRKHSQETKLKMSSTHKGNDHQKGQKNSQYGTCWIFNEQLKLNKKIKKQDLQFWLKEGWGKGRKIFENKI